VGKPPKNYKPRVRRESAVPKAVRPALARVGDPWVAPDGTKVAPILPSDFVPRVKEDTKINPVVFRGKRRRNLNELPAAGNMMNAIGALMMYSFFGVGDREVANALHCTVVELEEIRKSAAYAEYLDLIGSEIITADSDNIAHRIAAYSHGALDTIANVSAHGKTETNRLRASMDLMDRGGYAPKAVAEKQVAMKNVLRIQVLDDLGNGKDLNIQLTTEIGGLNGHSSEPSASE
jgi:hypothetical protein